MSVLPEFVHIQGHRIEYQWIRDPNPRGPVLVFLHEGLGSRAIWRDFPLQCSRAAGCDALVYSRYGYGQSDPIDGPRRPDYMHREALDALPEMLEKLGVREPVLVGHSDGASIALIYASENRPRGVIAMAPHVMVEPVAVEGVLGMKRVYTTTDLRNRLTRYHANPDSAFYGWSDIWASPEFRSWNIEGLLPKIACPVLAIQGLDDEYGTMEQLDRIARLTPDVELLKLENCRHSPHRDRTETVLQTAAGFIARLNTPNGTETGPLTTT